MSLHSWGYWCFSQQSWFLSNKETKYFVVPFPFLLLQSLSSDRWIYEGNNNTDAEQFNLKESFKEFNSTATLAFESIAQRLMADNCLSHRDFNSTSNEQ